MAIALLWPKDVWAILLQCKLVGKAQEACFSLSLEDSLVYENVKVAILRVYELVPEASVLYFYVFKTKAAGSRQQNLSKSKL